jgi:hypothetical protein
MVPTARPIVSILIYRQNIFAALCNTIIKSGWDFSQEWANAMLSFSAFHCHSKNKAYLIFEKRQSLFRLIFQLSGHPYWPFPIVNTMLQESKDQIPAIHIGLYYY